MLAISENKFSMLFGQIKIFFYKVLTAAFCVLISSSFVFSQTAVIDCAPATFNKYVKIMGTFRSMEVFTTTLVHAQSQAILEVDTGILMSNEDGGFFGPFGLLDKTTNKAQSEIKAVMAGGKRLKLDDQALKRLLEMSDAADEIITVGYGMVGTLKAGKVMEATRMFMERSLPAYKKSQGAAHTTISGLVRRSSKEALKCR